MTANEHELDITSTSGPHQESAPKEPDLGEQARQMASVQQAVRQAGERVLVLDYLEGQDTVIEKAHQYFVQQSEAELSLSYAGEWMLDNYYIVRQSLRQVGEDMPERYYRELPVLDSGSAAGYPRIYVLSREIVRQYQSHPDIEQVQGFIRAYQSETPLTMGELWALPTMLRVVLLENLTAALLELTDLGQEHERQELFASEPLAQGVPAAQIVANAIPALHALLNADWKSVFERLSLVEQALRDDPAGAYARMDFDTRDRYRKVVEDIASDSGRSQLTVAQWAVHLAKANADELGEGDPGRPSDRRAAALRRSHVGTYLLDRGRAELETWSGYRPRAARPWGIRLRRWTSQHAVLLYLGSIALLTCALVWGLVGIGWMADGTVLQLATIALVGSIPASAVAVGVVNWLATRMVPSQKLPKLDLSEENLSIPESAGLPESVGLPRDCRTMVVVPTLLSNEAEVDALLRQLELHFLSNSDPNLFFALLTDVVDAPEKHMPTDEALIKRAREGILRLNQEHRRDSPGPFYLFHRERRWNPSEEQWMGWERKRGKLVEFNRLLGGSTETSYVATVGDMQILPEIRYVITLDADTSLPRDSARRLVGTLAHPLNRAQFDPKTGAVVAGYTVLQPRTEIRPAVANRSLFARLFSGDRGIDLYSHAVSDVYQDLFGEGIYVGKGIYDVHAFERSLEGRVPENSLLSHDLFEGIHGRAGLVTDVILYEDYPPHYPAYAHRLHRWVRGDWQLLPWLLPRVPHKTEGSVPNALSVLDRWKILDNLRRSLVVPAQLAFFVLGWLWWPGSVLLWTLLGAGASAVPVLTGLLSVLAASVQERDVAVLSHRIPVASRLFDWIALLGRGLARLRADVLRWLLGLVFMPYQSIITVDAIASTLVRLLATRRHLLQWTTAAHTLRLFGTDLRVGVTWIRMGGAPVTALVAALLAGLLAPTALPVAAPLLLAWLASPQIAHWISKPAPAPESGLDAGARQQLRHLARRTWLYYERFVGPDDHWLPPDHYQEDPLGSVAHRTSPTNIGLFLLSTIGAYDLGYVGALELSVRLRDTFGGMEELERYRGHFLNWYDTRSLEFLTPRYVSTVDSGNLAGCLIALGEACAHVLQDPLMRRQAWEGLRDACALFQHSLDKLQLDESDRAIAPLREALGRIQEGLEEDHDKPQEWIALLIELQEQGWPEISERITNYIESHLDTLDAWALGDLRTWNQRVRYHLSWMRREVDTLLPWWAMLDRPPEIVMQAGARPELQEAWQELAHSLSGLPSVAELPRFCAASEPKLDRLESLLGQGSPEGSPRRDGSGEATGGPADRVEDALAWCRDLAGKLENARIAASGLISAYHDLRAKASALIEEMDFGFLFDRQRKVFRIGYNVMAERRDNSYYDLLASEARIASLVAIAKGDVPQSHWLHMARPLTQVNGTRALLSWSGTMFEYLMPVLLLESHPDTLLDQSCHAAVDRQIEYAQSRGIPWGISESAFYQFDARREYQYRAFGVPGLGLKRGLGDDLVVAPYASLLALPFRPRDVLRNIERFEELGMLGQYGLFDAADFTRSRLPLGRRYAVVRSYMAHHHGMILLSCVNSLASKIMVRRFHENPRIQSVALLLHEQVAHRAPLEDMAAEESSVTRHAEPEIPLTSWRATVDAVLPQVHTLSNGTYTTFITGVGGGSSQCVLPAEKNRSEGNVFALTRWRADTTLDDWGTWIYVLDQDSGDLWSVARQPTARVADQQEVWFDPYKAEFRRRDHDISLHMEVTVPPADNLEIRQITLTNHSDRTRHLALTSYGEVVLAPQETDRRHPAFNKLFIESEYLDEVETLLFARRPRSAKEAPIYLAHFLVAEEELSAGPGYETDRARFLGRGHTTRSPRALSEQDAALSATTGATLDPIMSLRHEVQLVPYATTQVAFVTVAAPSRDEALAVAGRYRQWETITRAFGLARSQSILELNELNLDAEAVERISRLFSALMYPHPALRPEPGDLAQNRSGQPGLWAYGISGDYPILLVRVGNQEKLELVTETLQAHAYWRNRQVKVDLVFLNERETGYGQELRGRLNRLIERLGADPWLNQRGGIFLLRADQMDQADRVLLATAARAVLSDETGSLADHLARLKERPVWLPQLMPVFPGVTDIAPTPPLERPADLLFDNGYGGFTADGREYVIDLPAGEWTPAPWINVLANPDFGCMVSEAGLGCTWAGNSGENRLTPWHNDPVSDRPAEALYLRDEETGQVWTPTPLPMRVRAPYLIRHGAGYTRFEHHSHGLKQQMRVFVVPDAPVKVVQIRLENTWDRNRRVTATFYAEWVLGTTRDTAQQYIIPEFDTETQALLARNPYNVEFGERVAFVSASQQLHGLSADRTEFLGELGDLGYPAALDRVGLSGKIEAGLDPCAAVQLHVDLAPGETRQVHFLLGQGADRETALQLVAAYRDAETVEAAWEEVNRFWDDTLGAVTVSTPDRAMDLLLNRWLLYQAISCRLWGRSALYQSSGAYGFRDQLQDVMAVLHAAPELAREHILRAARHQFEAGDVLHWWHPPSGRGVRTRISDDLLWLPYVAAHYVESTGDESILSKELPFLVADPLQEEEEERYGHYERTEQVYTLYEHCRRALDKSNTSGRHGPSGRALRRTLPLMGSGDWNDGMNRVGIEGRGESVWLGWFLYASLRRFAAMSERMDDGEAASRYRQRAEELRAALAESAWDGAWYRRAYYDDGSPLGSAQNRECQIDSIAQSWSVLSEAGREDRAREAMEALYERLVRPEERLLLLFAPPFDKTPRDPGYIKGYPPGIRENGGQYTHAALWAVWAFAELGQGTRAQGLFDLLNPIYHGDTPAQVQRYRVEPYVVAADVYGVPPHVGRGGWTWYTGSSAWMYRLGIEGILGVQRAGATLRIAPRISSHWQRFQVDYRFGDACYRIRVENPDAVEQGVQRVVLDGNDLPDPHDVRVVPLHSDGQEHDVRVVMG